MVGVCLVAVESRLRERSCLVYYFSKRKDYMLTALVSLFCS